MITLRQLRYLAALAEHRHFGRAAEACAVTQPALSMQIRELEKDLGVELVERRPGEVDAHRISASRWSSARRPRAVGGRATWSTSPATSGRLLTGRLRLGVIPTLAPYLLPRILPALQRRYPELRVELRETPDQGSARRARARRARRRDAGAAGRGERPRDHAAVRRSVPAGGPGRRSALARATRVNAATSIAQRLILLEEGHCLRDQALAYCAQCAAAPARWGLAPRASRP